MTPRRFAVAAALLLAAGAFAADWEAVGPGVDYLRINEPGIDAHVTRIDLTEDDVRVVVTRESERGMRVSEFAKKNKALAAINGDYFDDKMKPIGLTVGPCGTWEGTKDTAREGVVAVGRGEARIHKQSLVMDVVDESIGAAVSGWPLLVSECTPLTGKELPGSDAFTRAPHPRTAIGLSKDGKTLYFVVVDGRREDVGGMTLPELGQFMRDRLKVCSAINMDGGGSSAMWVEDRIVNKPSDGSERRVADHIAVVLASDYTGCDVPPATSVQAAEKGTNAKTSTQPR